MIFIPCSDCWGNGILFDGTGIYDEDDFKIRNRYRTINNYLKHLQSGDLWIDDDQLNDIYKILDYYNNNKMNESFNNESVYDIITNTVKKKYGIYTVKNNDFHLIFDLDEDILELTWITINTNKFTGKEVLLGLIEYCKQFDITKIKATGVRGKYHGKDAYGYYVMLHWGFIPILGINFINDVLNTNYKSFEEAYNDSNFLKLWKEKVLNIMVYLI